MSHPYTSPFGYPLTAMQALRRMNAKLPMHTGAVKGGILGGAPITVHAAAAEPPKKEPMK